MKKRLLGIFATILAVLVSVSGLFGCKLVTLDEERDSKQVVATIDIIQKDEITKMDIMVGYLEYGYYYVQSYGYAVADALQLVLDTQVNTRVIYQNAVDCFEKGEAPFDNCIENANAPKYSVDRYITEKEVQEATYNVRKAVENYLHTSLSEHHHGSSDTAFGEVRTTPTGATAAEVSYEDKVAYNEKAFEISGSEAKVKAFEKFTKYLKDNQVLGSDYDGTIESTAFYKNSLINQKEAIILEKYEKIVKEEAIKDLSIAMLDAQYKEEKKNQQNFSQADFKSALENATADSPILFNAYGTYGYVYNLLLGANEIQSAQLSALKLDKETDEYKEERNRILDSTLVKDLRDSWIHAGYDFDGEKFTGDYTFAKDSANSLPFVGTVTKLESDEEHDTDEGDAYSAVSKTMDLPEFISFMNKYVYGKDVEVQKSTNLDVYGKVQYNGDVKEYDAKMNELLFAFSTDAGSLNKYKGYAINPPVEGSNTETYVESFANAGRELLELGGKSYMIVASDYGYHVMFFSEVYTADYGYDNLEAYLNAVEGSKDWASELEKIKTDADDKIEDTYLNVLAQKYIDVKTNNAYTKLQTELQNKYIYSDNAKVTFNKTIAELFK